jgi:hypothetical protein
MNRPESKLNGVYFLKTEDAEAISSSNERERAEAFDRLPHSLSPLDIGYIAQHIHRTHYFKSERKIRAYQRRAAKSIGDMAMISAIKLEETGTYVTDLVTASSAAGYLESGGLVSKYYARRLRSQIENEFTDFSAKIDAGKIDPQQQ